ncbi:MAG: hypothetical protein CMJ78_21695 [Planctomycetaceae bacterium]|nr:hypothetical protein [Planctomycetaceae bacterium]
MTGSADISDCIRRLDEILRQVLASRADWVGSECGCALRETKSAKNVESTSIHAAVTHVDRELQEAVLQTVYAEFPDLVPLVEEDTAAAVKYRSNQGDRAFILDPIDGTQCFANGRHDYCTMAALSVAGQVVYGLVARYHPFDITSSLMIPSTMQANDLEQPKSPLRVACHYRLFRDPFASISERLQAAGLELGAVPLDESDYEANTDDWATGKGLGSNGNAILAFLNGHWDAYLAPMVNLHDFAGPLAIAEAAGAVIVQFDDASAGAFDRWQLQDPVNFSVASAAEYPARFRFLIARDHETAEHLVEVLQV